MKGFAYDTLINFSFDKKQRDEVIMYYAKEKKCIYLRKQIVFCLHHCLYNGNSKDF